MPRQHYIADLKKAGEGLSIAGNVSPPNMLARFRDSQSRITSCPSTR